MAAGSAGTDVVAGIDVGGTKLAIRVETLAGERVADARFSAAGSVIVHQPQLARAFRTCLARQHPRLTVRILDEEPVAGAVVLARRLQAAVSPG